ncbi:MAG: hypothetical protein ACOVP4_13540 [Bacteriovoracaceae bacterium]
MKKLILFLFSLLFLSSCGDDTFKKIDLLTEFRVLAIVADDSELAPGASTNVYPLIADISGGNRTIQGEVITCIDPGVSRGAPVSCDHDPSATAINYDIDTSTLAQGAQNTGLAQAQNITVPAAIFTGRSDREKFNGVSYLVLFTFDVDGKKVKAFRRINATNRAQRNANPATPTINLDGTPILNRVPAKGSTLSATSSAPESYQFITIDGVTESRTENLEVAWYLSEGEINKPKSEANEAVEYKGDAPTKPLLLMAIVRDERGGLSFRIEELP